MSYVGEIKDGVLKDYKGAPSANLKITTKAEKIGSHAFQKKKSLTSVTIHGGVTEIGEGAFESCEKLKTVKLSEGLRVIGDMVFSGCSALADLKIPESVEEIGDAAFYETPWLDGQPGDVRVGSILIRAADSVEYAFAPETVSIAGGAFRQCRKLEMLTIPEGVRGIGNRAFGRHEMHPYMGAGCVALRELMIPNSVEKLGTRLVGGCAALKTIRISEQAAAHLGEKMIENAFFLLPSPDEYAPDYALHMKEHLVVRYFIEDGVDVSGLQEALQKFARKKAVRTQLVTYFLEHNEPGALGRLLRMQKKPDLDELAGYFELAEKRQLTECKAILLDYQNGNISAAEVEKKAEADMEKAIGVRELTLSDWRKIFKIAAKDDKATVSGYVAEAAEATIPAAIGKYTVTEMKPRAFSGQKALKKLMIEAKLKTIPESAFSRSELEEITLPTALKTIEKEAFFGCRLKTLEFPKGLQQIGSYAFRYCNDLTELRFQAGLKRIGNRAFEHCGALEHVYLPGAEMEIDGTAFLFCDRLTIHAPAGSYAEQFAKEHNIPFAAE